MTAPRDRGARFVDDMNEDGRVPGMVVVTSVDQMTGPCPDCTGDCDPDRYLTDARPSVALAEHHDSVLALVAAVGGSGVRPVGAVVTGDDEIGDELVLHVVLPAGFGLIERNMLETALEDLLDVAVCVLPV